MSSAIVQSKGVTFEVSVADEGEVGSVEEKIKQAIEDIYRLALVYENSAELSDFLLRIAQARVAFVVFETVRGVRRK